VFGLTLVSYSITLNEINGGKINGLVIDSRANFPIEYANIAIFKASDSSFVSGTITNSSGKYTLSNVPYGNFYLIIQFVGYKKHRVDNLIVTIQNKVIDIPSIKLEEEIFELNEVSIQSEQKTVEQKIDKKVIYVSKNLSSVGGTAIDILQNNAFVKTNIDGEVLLRNSTNFLVLLDGRQSPFQGSEALRQIPANSIETIEIITNPSAKFNAEGVAGIINIVTKKQILKGLSGIVNTSYSSNESYSGDFLFNLKKEKINIFLGADIRENVNNQYFDIKRNYLLNNTSYFNDEVVDQTGIRPSSNLKLGLDYEFNSKNNLSFINTIGTSNFHKNKSVYNKQWTATDGLVSYFANNETYDVDGYFINPAILFVHKFKEKGNEISLDFSYTYLNSGFDQLSKDFDTDQDYFQIDAEPEILKSSNNYERFIYELKTDYSFEINERLGFESGLLISRNKRNVSLDFENYDYLQNNWKINQEFSNNLVFNQQIYGAFLMIMGKADQTEYQLGLRSEITDRILEQQTSNIDYTYQKLHLFPTFHLSRQVSEKLQLQASYSRRIQRPTDFWLNPFPSSRSSKLMNIGNPDLVPDITDSYEFNITKIFKPFTLSINSYYRYTKNALTQITLLDSNGGHVMTYGNMNLNRFAGSEFSSSFKLFKTLKLYPSVDLFYMLSKGRIEDFNANYSAFSFTIRLNSSCAISKTTLFQLNAEYYGKAVMQQGDIDPFYLVTASVKQELLKKNLTLVLQARNLFESGKIKMDENGSNFINRFAYMPENNIITLNISYKINNFKRNNRIQQNVINEKF